ncbi:hypothetical protein GCM10010493_43270 [Streptomyces lavendulae subsp. grasserius]
MTNAVGHTLLTLDAGDVPRKLSLTNTTQAVLLAHRKGEENGLFPLMSRAPSTRPIPRP